MRANTQAEAFFGGALFIGDDMGVVRLHPSLARVYMIQRDSAARLHVPLTDDLAMLGPMFYVLNEGTQDVEIWNDVEGVQLGVIEPARVGIVVRIHTGSAALVPTPGGVPVPPYRVFQRVSY